MDEQMTEEEEEEEEKGQRDTQPEEEDKFKSTKIQMACFGFFELSCWTSGVRVEDYECALVDALAVLGRGEYGWRDAESYPPILSRIIKVARLCHTVLNDQVNYPTCGGGMDVHSIQGRSGYEIQHIQIKSDNSAGKGLHCGVKVNELSRTRWTQTRWTSNPSKEPIHPLDPNPLDEPINLLEVEHAGRLYQKQAVQMAEDEQVEHPADALDAMRERFLLPGVAAPFGWVTRLRTFGKRVQNTTTSLGYVCWSDDQQTLSYRELHLSIAGLRRFVRTQVELTQHKLEQLFLVHEEEAREVVVPRLALAQLADSPTNNHRGWNFLQAPQNCKALPTTGERWLLDRVLTTDRLRAEWVAVRPSDHQVVWDTAVVDDYLQQVDEFLEQLLLVVHLTGGQRARATELLSIRHSNTVCGRHRSIFIEHGLVSMVTTYHKGYSMTNSTKIIHRYLPAETKLNVIPWRHAAIAISRMHLSCGGFKREYGADDAAVDQQAGHGSWAAGTVYARGLQEAPGHIEARRVRYQAVSREWHEFLGFNPGPGVRKRVRNMEKSVSRKAQKQQPSYVTVEIDDNIEL
ncbi:predicted protein [Histoplasma mississippiense (nom. inval.)]|uniref:predicted protein n=1 Tax=Ajellomyces capsulatus (strain NAm1 / WU24) TaxID=2059318 RepID=UPI000157D33D|nr:predicted protein [Histoplasma mississippiense (nom. inval.)]EDN04930.1 predicted protein [Histoplasma mississippiense (nom. inval.)]